MRRISKMSHRSGIEECDQAYSVGTTSWQAFRQCEVWPRHRKGRSMSSPKGRTSLPEISSAWLVHVPRFSSIRRSRPREDRKDGSAGRPPSWYCRKQVTCSPRPKTSWKLGWIDVQERMVDVVVRKPSQARDFFKEREGTGSDLAEISLAM
jgi:hypothetical protein